MRAQGIKKSGTDYTVSDITNVVEEGDVIFIGTAGGLHITPYPTSLHGYLTLDAYLKPVKPGLSLGQMPSNLAAPKKLWTITTRPYFSECSEWLAVRATGNNGFPETESDEKFMDQMLRRLYKESIKRSAAILNYPKHADGYELGRFYDGVTHPDILNRVFDPIHEQGKKFLREYEAMRNDASAVASIAGANRE